MGERILASHPKAAFYEPLFQIRDGLHAVGKLYNNVKQVFDPGVSKRL